MYTIRRLRLDGQPQGMLGNTRSGRIAKYGAEMYC